MEETSSSPCPHCGYVYRKQENQSFSLQPGTILHGKYLIGRVLGQGGFGITYIGWDLALSKKVAIKEYYPSSYVTRSCEISTALQWFSTQPAKDARETGKESFLKEARKMVRVNSIPQVVHIRDLFEDNNTAYIVMEYIPGETLAKRIRRTGPMSWESVRDLLLPVADVMQQVHDAGLIHRDLSPDNLMILPDGSIRILDLGAAKDLNLQSGASSVQVAKGGFSPMEQYVMKGQSGPWTDVYSLAATMYYSLTGKIPPSAVDRMAKDNLAWDLPQLLQLPPSVIQALKKSMAIPVKERTQDMASFASGIRSSSPGEKRSKKPVVIAAAALAAVALLGILIGAFLSPKDKKAAVETVPTETSAVVSLETTAAEEPDAPWAENVLIASVIPGTYEYDQELAPVFNSRIARYQIVSATFLDSLQDMGADSWDVSQARDGSVMAWTKKHGTVSRWVDGKTVESDAYDLYIAAEGGINGRYCSHLFEGFDNITAIHFNDSFHTDYAESMESMFDGCYALTDLDVSSLKTDRVRSMRRMFSCCDVEELDLRHFNTSNVESMDNMFNYCSNLRSLDLGSFDTSKVTNMSDMFCLTTMLTELNIRSFDTSKVTDMGFMFSHTGLADLDLTHFDTSQVTSICYMFSGCENLKTLDVRGFDTSRITDMQGTFSNCPNLERISGISDWDTSNVDSYEDFMDAGDLINGKPWKDLFR